MQNNLLVKKLKKQKDMSDKKLKILNRKLSKEEKFLVRKQVRPNNT